MGFTLSELANKDQKQLSYKFDDGDEFKYSVSINRMNFAMMGRLQDAAGKIAEIAGGDEVTPEQEEAVVVLMELMTGWDLVDPKTKKEAEITRDNVLQIPLPMLSQMLETIMNQLSPNPTNASSSSDGSTTPQ